MIRVRYAVMPAAALLAHSTQAVVIDAYAEVTTAVYASSVTQSAYEMSADAKLRKMRREIEVLRSQLTRSGTQSAKLRRQLTTMQQNFVAQLAEKDRAYAQSIPQYRSKITDIADTAEGALALARYNAGDADGALTILDTLRKANDVAAARRIAALALDARNNGKVTTASVIRRYEEITRLDPGEFWDWIELARLYEDVDLASQASRAIAGAMNAAHGDQDRYVVLNETGNVALKQSRSMVEAGRAYSEAVGLARKLASANPTDGSSRRNLAVALEKIGGVSDLAGASAAYGEALSICRQLALASPKSKQAQLDLAVALSYVGDIFMRQRNLSEAYHTYSEQLEIMRELVNALPDYMELQRDLAISLTKLGDIALSQCQTAASAEKYTESLAIDRKIAARDPGNLQSRRFVAVDLSNLGDLKLQQKDFAAAASAHDEALAIFRDLVDADPDNPQGLDDLAQSLQSVGDVKNGQGDTGVAVRTLQESLAIARKLAQAEPDYAQAQLDVAVSLFKLADTPGSGTPWQDAVAQLETMAAKGILEPADRHWLIDARTNAIKQKQTKAKSATE